MLSLFLFISFFLPVDSSGILTRSCVMTKVMSSIRSDVWKCLVDSNDYGGRSNHKLEIVGLNETSLSKVVSGVTFMTATGAEIFNRTINITGVETSFQTPANKAKIASKVGARTVLAVRVISNDGSNPLSVSQLADNVFTDSVNMIERFASCSYNKLTFRPYSGTLNGKRITNGMYEVKLNVNTRGMDEGQLDEEAIDQLNRDLGSNFADAVDHVMIFAPDNLPEFGANAEFDGKFSLYDGFEASFSSVTLVHEIGHNLHLDHSSEGSDEYGDDTCSMGFGLNVDDFRVCFNPPKSWALGWYSDKHLSLDVSTVGDVQEHTLVGIAEYDKAGSNSLFIKLDNGGSDFYIGFNRAVGINSDQIEAVDQVTITKSRGGPAYSFLVGKLSEGESFSIKSIKGRETDVEIRVTSIDTSSTPAVARVRISSSQGDGSPGDDDDAAEPSFDDDNGSDDDQSFDDDRSDDDQPLDDDDRDDDGNFDDDDGSDDDGFDDDDSDDDDFDDDSDDDNFDDDFYDDGIDDDGFDDDGFDDDGFDDDGFDDDGFDDDGVDDGDSSRFRKSRKNADTKTTSCFSGFNQVNVEGKGFIEMRDLQIGDRVESSQGFSTVYTFLHVDHHAPTIFIKLDVENGMTLEISPSHLLYIDGTMRPAKDARIGDRLSSGLITFRQTVQRHGYYAPATLSGDMLVNGILASNYVTLLSSSAIAQHRIAHAYMAPMRYWSALSLPTWSRCFTASGFSAFVYPLVMAAHLLARFPSWVQYTVTAVVAAPIVVVVEALDAATRAVRYHGWMAVQLLLLLIGSKLLVGRRYRQTSKTRST